MTTTTTGETLAGMKLGALLDMSGKVAIVTGAAMGIGQAIARRFAEAGAHVVLADRDEKAAHETAAAIGAAGGSAEVLLLDVSDASMVASGIDRVARARGRLDYLINNAGIYPMRPFLESDDELWRKTLDVNVLGTMRCTRAAAPHMTASGGGAIVNLASIAGLHPEGDLAHYETSKGAVVMMTRSLAMELAGARIRVNAVAPGGVQTPGARASIEPLLADPKKLMARSKSFFSRIPLKRMGEPDDIARAVLFLASPMADYITGAILVADGGFLLS